ncbi:MAG: DinB family protein [Roseiflexaceae bacterium]
MFEQHRLRPFADIHAESERVYTELITLVQQLSEVDLTTSTRFAVIAGERPLYTAFLGGCYEHDQEHLAQYALDHRNLARAIEIREQCASRVVQTAVPDWVKGWFLYNLACFYAQQQELNKAAALVQAACTHAPELKARSQSDPDLAAVRDQWFDRTDDWSATMQDTAHGGDTSVLKALFAHNAWANLKLLDFCEQLSDEQLNAQAIGCFGSIRATLWHIIGGEVSYVERVNGKRLSKPLPDDAFPGFAALKGAVRWTSEELLQLALSVREGTLVREPPPDDTFQYRLASLMVQAINHATEHRTQIAAIITQLGLAPPDMSGWQYLVEIGEFQEQGAGLAK